MPNQNNKIEVLFVDDNDHDAEIAVEEFRANDLVKNFIRLRDGQEAFDFLFGNETQTALSINNLPSLIMLDINMPKIDGIELLEIIKADPRTCAIPVVMLTSSGEDSDLKRCYELGVNSYIVKPMNFDGFSASLRSVTRYWLSVNHPLMP